MDGSFEGDNRRFVSHTNTVGNDRLLRNATFGMSLIILTLFAVLLCGVALCSHSGIRQDEPVPGLGGGP